MKPLTTKITAAIIAVCLIAPATALASSQPRDADANAMMFNGAYSRDEFVQKLTHGDGHTSAATLQAEYAKYGVTVASIKSNNIVNGTVTKEGRVIVAGKTVATDANSFGRSYMAGSVRVGDLWRRPTSVSFAQQSLPAYVSIKNGHFNFAIIKSCGNVVVATPLATKPVTRTVTKTVSVVQTNTQIVNVAAPQPVVASNTPLPQTGAAQSGAVGITAILIATWYYRQSRRRLKRALVPPVA
jgi:hypothetical protein